MTMTEKIKNNYTAFLASFTSALVVVLLGVAINQMIAINRKLDALNVAVALNTSAVEMIEKNERRIDKLEINQITSIADIHDWVDARYLRK